MLGYKEGGGCLLITGVLAEAYLLIYCLNLALHSVHFVFCSSDVYPLAIA